MYLVAFGMLHVQKIKKNDALCAKKHTAKFCYIEKYAFLCSANNI